MTAKFTIHSLGQVGSPHCHSTADRRAAVLLATVTCLAVASLLMGSWVVTLMNNSRQLRLQHRHLQATLLADAAIQRAAQQLATNPEYVGENWRLPDSVCRQQGETIIEPEITIRIIDELDRTKRRVTAEVHFPTVSDQTGTVIREQLLTATNAKS